MLDKVYLRSVSTSLHFWVYSILIWTFSTLIVYNCIEWSPAVIELCHTKYHTLCGSNVNYARKEFNSSSDIDETRYVYRKRIEWRKKKTK